jgi:hypothetical protein
LPKTYADFKVYSEKKTDHISVQHRHETNLVKQIREKLNKHNAVVTQADNRNSIIIVYSENYEQNMLNFISESGAMETNEHTTKQFQTALRRTINY